MVDDAVFMRKMLTDILVKGGHIVVAEAGTGREALERYKECKPDIVTMDITMPDMDGIDGLKAIKEFDSNAKVIMCSAMGQQTMVLDAVQNGAKDFIVKPFQATKVLESIQKLL